MFVSNIDNLGATVDTSIFYNIGNYLRIDLLIKENVTYH